MSGSNVWSRSRERLRRFPELLAQCADELYRHITITGVNKNGHSTLEAAVYGKCVAATTTGKRELKKDLCATEFEALKTCFTNAAKKKTR
ncbi:NADH dehydrogenase [ubiquinone] 1 alpha subcomplex assembly factor 8 isoform X1 [Xiphophorus couchianus]|uniref:NADH dehydrogenase [ubiquinone] 1 alpha subcomplex assembly factor 8 isoform X1 n=1 Tax=Xiphophorus couchianus TaxID=32473 RepID=UPI0010170E40|nr:NADH dehydrogenase [ubiquinone] 1 alpha subcomplex assembly factor 8 isoform X1 [Xiphophorus couchianus]